MNKTFKLRYWIRRQREDYAPQFFGAIVIAILLLAAILVAPYVHGVSDIPYAHAPGVLTCDFGGGTYPSEWSQINGQNGALVNGQTDTDFIGQTLISINVYLCLNVGASNPPNPPNPGETFVTIGVFDANGNTVSVFGTVDIASLPITYMGHSTTAQSFTKTAVHSMSAGEIVGIKFADYLHGINGYYIQTFCGGSCGGSEVAHGSIVDCVAVNSCSIAPGNFAFAGTFLFAAPNTPLAPQTPAHATGPTVSDSGWYYTFLGIIAAIVGAATVGQFASERRSKK